VSAVDDAIVDGTQSVTIGASAAGYLGGGAALSVTDNEPTFSTVSLDFGTATSPVAAGYRRVTNTTTFSTALGYGWTGGTVSAVDRGTSDPLTRDFNSTPAATFAVTVPNGTYDVRITLGDSKASHDKMAVSLEGNRVATVSTKSGQFSPQTFRVTVSDGQLTLRLDDLGGSDKVVAIDALVLTLVQSAVAPGSTSALSLGPCSLPRPPAPYRTNNRGPSPESPSRRLPWRAAPTRSSGVSGPIWHSTRSQPSGGSQTRCAI